VEINYCDVIHFEVIPDMLKWRTIVVTVMNISTP